MDYEAVIGLETHVQLKTKSKMWCGCANAFGAPPNTNVCPVCLGLPGVLPVANEEALRLTVLTGLLLNCQIPARAKFDRKNYFYPDMPKNYQITQYDQPSTADGCVDFEFNGGMARVRITRAHLEEDVGKSFHFERNSGVDFNRAGVPLLEIVSEPDLTSADMAYEYLNALKDILRNKEGKNVDRISDCDMEKGMVRCDVNVSVRPKGAKELGAKIEIKNMNSFSGVRRALEYEIPRQIEIVKSGGKLVQSTRRWDDVAGITEEMRTKEDAHDYRYFPDPDLMPFAPTDAWLDEVQSRKWELPLVRKRRWRMRSLTEEQIEALENSSGANQYFETITTTLGESAIGPIANLLVNELIAIIKSEGHDPNDVDTYNKLKFTVQDFQTLVGLFVNKEINSSATKIVLAEMYKTGKSPAAIVREKGLAQVSDTGAIEKFCDEAIAVNPGPVADFKSGKAAALNFLKGQVMKLSRGNANPALAGEILERKLKV